MKARVFRHDQMLSPEVILPVMQFDLDSPDRDFDLKCTGIIDGGPTWWSTLSFDVKNSRTRNHVG